MLDETKANDQAQRDRGPARNRKSTRQVEGNVPQRFLGISCRTQSSVHVQFSQFCRESDSCGHPVTRRIVFSDVAAVCCVPGTLSVRLTTGTSPGVLPLAVDYFLKCNPAPRQGIQYPSTWSALSEGKQWDCPGNKIRSHRQQSAGSSYPNRCPRDYCTPSRCAGACACASAEPGSPIASTSSCFSKPTAIRWHTSRKPTSLRTSYNALSILPGTTTSGSPLGTPSGWASRARCEGHGSTSNCPPTRVSCRHGSHSLGRPWRLFTKKTNGSWAMLPTATTASTSARPRVTSWSAIVTASSPIPSDR